LGSLAYYATKKIISEYKGGSTGYKEGKTKVEQEKSKAAYYYSLAMRYNQKEEAQKYLNQYIDLIGTSISELSSIGADNLAKTLIGTGGNPANGLNILETIDLQELISNPNYEPITPFGKSLNPRELAIMKDGARFYYRISGFETLYVKK